MLTSPCPGIVEKVMQYTLGPSQRGGEGGPFGQYTHSMVHVCARMRSHVVSAGACPIRQRSARPEERAAAGWQAVAESPTSQRARQLARCSRRARARRSQRWAAAVGRSRSSRDAGSAAPPTCQTESRSGRGGADIFARIAMQRGGALHVRGWRPWSCRCARGRDARLPPPPRSTPAAASADAVSGLSEPSPTAKTPGAKKDK